MTIEVRSSGGQGQSTQENNKQNFAFDTHIDSTTGRHRVYVHIFSTETSPQVRLYLYGLATNIGSLSHLHSNSGRTSNANVYFPTSGDSFLHSHTFTRNTGLTGNLTQTTSVPQEVTIWIDGVEKTATIGDANSKGATMYDSTNDDWGIDGTTEWNTGELDLTSLITWSVGEHYIELRCAGTGGRLLGNIYIN